MCAAATMAADPAGMATTSEDFIKGLSLAPASAAPAVESAPLRTRGLSLGTGDVAPQPTPVSVPAAPPAPPPSTPSPAAAQRPSVNFQVEFERNSATLSPKARKILDQLGRALTAPELAGFRFELAGHTDVTGSTEHNLTLSKRRAASVRDYLTTTFQIPSRTLTTAGYGSQRLLDPVNRTSGVNRRVEITNLGS
nr:OmpA family protein [Azospirillum doebereinerae]